MPRQVNDPTTRRAGGKPPTRTELLKVFNGEVVYGFLVVCRFCDISWNDLLEIRRTIREKLRETAPGVPDPEEGEDFTEEARVADEDMTMVKKGQTIAWAQKGDRLMLWQLPNTRELEVDLHPLYMHVRFEDAVGAPVFGYKDSDNYATYEENDTTYPTVNYEVRQEFLRWLVRNEMLLMKVDPELREKKSDLKKRFNTHQYRDGETQARPVSPKKRKQNRLPVRNLALTVHRPAVHGKTAKTDYLPATSLMCKPLNEYGAAPLPLSDIDFAKWNAELKGRFEIKPSHSVDGLEQQWHTTFAVGDDVANIATRAELVAALEIAYGRDESNPEPEFEHVLGPPVSGRMKMAAMKKKYTS